MEAYAQGGRHDKGDQAVEKDADAIKGAGELEGAAARLEREVTACGVV